MTGVLLGVYIGSVLTTYVYWFARDYLKGRI